MTNAARTHAEAVNAMTPVNRSAPNFPRTIVGVSNAALKGPTRTFPIPWRKMKTEKSVNTDEASLSTALLMATRMVPNPKPKKPYMRLNVANRPADFPRPQSVDEAAAAVIQQIIERTATENLLSDK